MRLARALGAYNTLRHVARAGSTAMTRAHAPLNLSDAPRIPSCLHVRTHATKPPSDGEDEYDEFGMDAFGDADYAEDREDVPEVDKPMDDSEMTPEMADELVERMVAAATASRTAASTGTSEVQQLTPHMISVLRASRVTTNEIIGPGVGPEDYPINRKVVAELDPGSEALGLSTEARAALAALAGPRYNADTGIVKVVGHKYASSVENQALVVARMDRLVREARRCVGEQVDDSPIASWDDVVQEVVRQTGKDEQFVADITAPRDVEEESFDTAAFETSQLQ